VLARWAIACVVSHTGGYRAIATFTHVSGAELGLAISVFLACAVEAVEALTIVMAVGNTRSWPSALSGAAAAAVALGGIVAGLGAAVTSLPIDTLRLLVGVLLLAFGLQWLRKAVLRASGLKALRDERSAYERERAAAREAGRGTGSWDAYSFVISMKSVMIEGLEVALIVVSFAASHRHHTALAVIAAALAVASVIAAGVAVRAPLARVPENTMKFAVGVMLCSYGIFWGAEGAGLAWPGGDAVLLAIVPVLLCASLLAVASLRRLSAG
jgi:uncharacterized membrane protein